MTERSAEYSKVISKYIVMPHQSNPNGLLFGGVLMSWIDLVAAMVAEKHSGMNVTTVQVDKINFTSPIKIGDHVTVEGVLIATGKSSMRILVTVDAEDVKQQKKNNTTKVELVFVAVDENMKSCAIPRLEEPK